VGQIKLSADGARLAYTLPQAPGSDASVAIARCVATGARLRRGLIPGVASVEWSAGGGELLYTRPDASGRPHQLWRRELGASGAAAAPTSSTTPAETAAETPDDALLLQEDDAAVFLELGRTKDGAFVSVNANSKLCSEVRLLDASAPRAPLALVAPRIPGREYFVEHAGGTLYILTNDGGGGDYRLAAAPVTALPGGGGASGAEEGGAAGGGGGWATVMPAREGASITDIDMFEGRVALYERRRGAPAVSIADLPCPGGALAAPPREVALPPWATCVRPGANLDFRADTLRLLLSSPLQPARAFDVHLASGRLSEVPADGGAGAAALPAAKRPRQRRPPPRHAATHEVLRLEVAAEGGAAVPLTVVRPRAPPGGDGGAGGSPGASPPPPPLLLHVYGAYGHVLEADHDPYRSPLLAAGWALGFAHVRGGGERGRPWHAAGRQALKARSAADLVACAEALVARGLAAPGRVALHAFSAGGIAAAGALNAAPPGTFAAAVLRAPFLDLLSCMADADAPLTRHEYDEWGNPGDASGAGLSAACPYLGLAPGRPYPPVLLTCALDDARVPPWAPAKYAARLRALQRGGGGGPDGGGGGGIVLLRAAPHGGHFAHLADPATAALEEAAFLLREVGAGRGRKE